MNGKKFFCKHCGVFKRAFFGLTAFIFMLSGFMGNMNVFAAGSNTVNIELVSTEHGMLSFEDSEDYKKSVPIGTTVTVNVKADEGYVTGSVDVTDKEGNTEMLKVVDNKVNIHVVKDIDVSAYFMERDKALQNAEAFALVEPKATLFGMRSRTLTDKAYILENMDRKYVGEGNELLLSDMINTTISVADGTHLKDKTLDGLWSISNNSDGVYANALINQTVVLNGLYSVSDNADYYVGRVGVSIENAKVTDWGTAHNNGMAEMITDIEYDEDTGLVYVPKKYTKERDGKKYVLDTRIQLLYTTDSDAKDSHVNLYVKVNGDDVSGVISGSGSAQSSVYTVGTEIKLAQDEEAKSVIADYSIDSIVLNGMEYTDSDGVWTYYEDTGCILINVSPIGLNTVEVNLSNSFSKDTGEFFRSMFGMTRAGGSYTGFSSIGQFKFPSQPYVNQNFYVDSGNIYNIGGMSGYTNPLISLADYSAGNYETRYVQSAFGNNVYSASDFDVLLNSIERAAHIREQTVNGIKVPDLTVNLACAHIALPIEGGMDSMPGAMTEFPGKARIYIHAINGNDMLIGITNPKLGAQSGGGFFRATYKVDDGKVKLKKTSAKPEYTNGNSAYSLQGAHYGIYSDSACTTKVKELVTDVNGETTKVTLGSGTYWVKEISPSKGYELNPNKKQITVSGGSDSTVTLNGDMAEQPLDDPFMMLLQKATDGQTQAGRPNGDVPTLAGIKFRVSYYNDIYTSADEAEQHTATASAIFETDDDGFLVFRFAKPIDNTSWPYKTEVGDNTIPLGTVVIREVSTLDGLIVRTDAQAFTITDTGETYPNGIAKPTVTPIGQWPTQSVDDGVGAFDNESWYGGVTVYKADNDSKTQVPSGDASLIGVEYTIYNKSLHEVYVNGKMYDVNSEIMKIYTSDVDGKILATTGNDTLPYGTYQITETNGNTSYNNGGWSKTFKIRADGQMVNFDTAATGWNENPVKRGGVIIGKTSREGNQYISQGDAHLDGSKFEIVNKSKNRVKVKGEWYDPNDVVMTITTQEMEHNGRTIYAATTGDNVLPYGTYDIYETGSGKGYLFDSVSKQYHKTFTIREDGQMVDFTDESETVANQVMRQDWYFQKKDDATMDGMNKVPFLVTSRTTGEQHVIVTDENGMWGSSWTAHTNNTNANDPTAPNTNGAMDIDENGNWYVKDFDLLDYEAGTWFTGMPSDITKWNANGKSYTVNGKTVNVDDTKRSFPYDVYDVQELRCDTNVNHTLVKFTVTLHRYTSDHDGPGVDIDYGTIIDKLVYIDTRLVYNDYDKIVPAAEEVTLHDVVTYDSIDVNKNFTMRGELHLVDEDGNDEGAFEIVEQEFNSGEGSGEVVMDFTIDTSKLGGRKIVAFEYLMDGDEVMAKHADLEDDNQTVIVPKLGTTLSGDSGHESNGSVEEIRLTDTIDYFGLEVGKTYKLTGTLMNAETGDAVVDIDGNPVTATKMFEPVASDGTETVEFVFKSNDIAGKTVVAFEEVSRDDSVYAVHADITDENQTVTFPKIETEATDEVDSNHEIAEAEHQTIIDHVTLTNLQLESQYKLISTLHVRNQDGIDEGEIVNEDGDAITVETMFDGNMTETDIKFEDVNASKFGGKDIVVFQTLYRITDDTEIIVGTHTDINDENQTVHVPHIGTTLVNDKDMHEMQIQKSKVMMLDEIVDDADDEEDIIEDSDIRLTDTVAYENLTPGVEYTMRGTLHIVENNEDNGVTSDKTLGKAIVDSVIVFTPEEANGTVDVEFDFDATDLDGKSVVAVESVYREDDEKQIVAKHEDANDENQTVHFVDMGTTLTSDTNGSEVQLPETDTYEIHLVDTVAYQNLIVGCEYTVTGVLHVRDEDGNDSGIMKDAKGNVVTSTTTFTPMTSDGEVKVVFDFVGKDLEQQTIVAFESMSHQGKTFAVHADINDESQTVRFMSLDTVLMSGDSKTVKADTDIELTDTITYQNLMPEKEYRVIGSLVNGEGEPVTFNGKNVVVESTFVPEDTDGEVEMTFHVDTSKMANNDKIIAIESVYDGEALIAVHDDLKDEDQMVTVIVPIDPNDHVDLETGVTNYSLPVAIIMIVTVVCGGAYLMYRRRNVDAK